MSTALFIVGAILTALLQTTWFSNVLVTPLLLVAIVLYVDIVPASVAAFFVGLTLDVLGIHVIGTSSTIMALLLVGGSEALRLSNRWVDEHPGSTLIASTVALVSLISLLGGAAFHPGFVATYAMSLAGHVLLAAMLTSAFQVIGDRYRASQRERGVL